VNYKTFFKGKRIAVVGLGPHGEMVADIKFLLKTGAQVAFFDMRSEVRLQGSVDQLKDAGLINFTFGKVPAEDLANAELVIISPEISRKSIFLKQATEAGVQIEYPETLFLKLAIPFTLVGIMGEAGKSTVAHMLYNSLKQAFSNYEDQGLFFIDPDLPHGALTHLKKLKNGDIVLVRITDEMSHEYTRARVSPHVAVVTSVPQNPKKILKLIEYQTYNNFIVAPDSVVDILKGQSAFASKAKVLRTHGENTALVVQAAELFKVDAETVQKIIASFSGLKGHQELVKKIGGIEFYNDSASVTPTSTLYALRKLSINKNAVLILGGAYTGANYSELIRYLPDYAHTVILVPGSGSLGIRENLQVLEGIDFNFVPNLETAVSLAKQKAKKGDRVIFSPGFEAIGIHTSRKERGEKFVKAVRGL
jgi:UDP-N-acetylmuramoylalanine--D-glutamate ligase